MGHLEQPLTTCHWLIPNVGISDGEFTDVLRRIKRLGH